MPQTQEQKNAHKRQNYARPEVRQRQAAANKKWYLKRIADDGECRPDYGIAFKSSAVQKTLTIWVGL